MKKTSTKKSKPAAKSKTTTKAKAATKAKAKAKPKATAKTKTVAKAKPAAKTAVKSPAKPKAVAKEKPNLFMEIIERKKEAQKAGGANEPFDKFKRKKGRNENNSNIGPSWGPRKGN